MVVLVFFSSVGGGSKMLKSYPHDPMLFPKKFPVVAVGNDLAFWGRNQLDRSHNFET